MGCISSVVFLVNGHTITMHWLDGGVLWVTKTDDDEYFNLRGSLDDIYCRALTSVRSWSIMKDKSFYLSRELPIAWNSLGGDIWFMTFFSNDGYEIDTRKEDLMWWVPFQSVHMRYTKYTKYTPRTKFRKMLYCICFHLPSVARRDNG